MLAAPTSPAIERQWMCRQIEGSRFKPAAKSSSHMAGTTTAGGSTIDSDAIDSSAKPKPEKPRTTPAMNTQAQAKARTAGDIAQRFRAGGTSAARAARIDRPSMVDRKGWTLAPGRQPMMGRLRNG